MANSSCGALVPALLLAIAGPSCADGVDCQRFRVTRDGRLEGALQQFQFDSAAWGVAGHPFSFHVWAPLTACPSDALRVSKQEMVDGSGARKPTLVGEPFASPASGIVGVSVLVDDPVEGEFSLAVAFEPSLGLRQTSLRVVADGLAREGRTVGLPVAARECNGGIWPLNESTVACEWVDGEVIVVSSTGWSARFPGRNLVTADNVTWSVRHGALERRELDSTGLALTDVWPGVDEVPFEETPFAGEHSSRFALRRDQRGRLVGALAGGEARVLSAYPPSRSPHGALLRGTWQWSAWAPTTCAQGWDCAKDVRAIEPELLWKETPDHALSAQPRLMAPQSIWNIARPVSQEPIPSTGFSVAPLWLPTAVVGMEALVTADNASMSVAAWPRERVLGVSREFLVLGEVDDQHVIVYSRWTGE